MVAGFDNFTDSICINTAEPCFYAQDAVAVHEVKVYPIIREAFLQFVQDKSCLCGLCDCCFEYFNSAGAEVGGEDHGYGGINGEKLLHYNFSFLGCLWTAAAGV